MLKKILFLSTLALIVFLSQATAQTEVSFQNAEKVASYGEPVDNFGYLISLEDYATNSYQLEYMLAHLRQNNPLIEFRYQPDLFLLKALTPRTNQYSLEAMRAKVVEARIAMEQIIAQAGSQEEANLALKQALSN
jgi:type VI protein secretion system component VasF